MSRYYCPFCPNRYQFHKTRSDGVLICAQCGDSLIKKPLLDSRRIIGFILFLAFLSPLVITFYFVIKDFTKEKGFINDESIGLLESFK